MSWYGVKRSSRYAYEDNLWAAAIRRRDNFTCRMCGRKDRKLDAAHYRARAKMGTRFECDNGVLLCAKPCHETFDRGKTRDRTGPSDVWMREQLGEQRYQRLLILSSATLHPNREAIRQSLRGDRPWENPQDPVNKS